MAMRASTVEALEQKSYSYDCLPVMIAVDSKVQILLTQLCLDLDKELVVFFDEADCLAGPSIITFLALIRDGYNIRANPGNKFPRALALVGMRNIRDCITQNHSDGESAPPGLSFQYLCRFHFFGQFHPVRNQDSVPSAH
jgi:hypothetical protein